MKTVIGVCHCDRVTMRATSDGLSAGKAVLLRAALLAFYGKILQPEFLSLKEKLDEHDGKLAGVLNHFDPLYKRLESLEEEYHTIVDGLERIEKKVGIGMYKPDKL
jgi:predicted nuclease with TOPRIM domain